MRTLVRTVFYIVCIGLVCWLLTWLIGYVGLPEPFHKIALVTVAVFGVFAVIFAIMDAADFRPWKRE